MAVIPKPYEGVLRRYRRQKTTGSENSGFLRVNILFPQEGSVPDTGSRVVSEKGKNT